MWIRPGWGWWTNCSECNKTSGSWPNLTSGSPLLLSQPYKPTVARGWVAQLCLTLCDPKDCSPPGSSVHGDSPGKNTGVDCHALLQGIFPTQGLNQSLLNCRWVLYTIWATREAQANCYHLTFSQRILSSCYEKFSTWCPLKVTKLGSQIRGTTASWQVGKAIIRKILVRCLSKEIPNYWTQFILGN